MTATVGRAVRALAMNLKQRKLVLCLKHVRLKPFMVIAQACSLAPKARTARPTPDIPGHEQDIC
jgi:hypothetical protein